VSASVSFQTCKAKDDRVPRIPKFVFFVAGLTIVYPFELNTKACYLFWLREFKVYPKQWYGLISFINTNKAYFLKIIYVKWFQNYSLVKYSELSTGWTSKESRFDLLKGQKLFYSSLGSTQHPNLWAPGAFPPELRYQVREADHSRLSTVELLPSSCVFVAKR